MPPISSPYTASRIRKGSTRNNIPTRVNLAAWYRFHLGITNVSGKCSSWYDYSGNQRPLLQATASARPTINSDGSLTFDGVSQYLQAAFTLAQPFTIYAALRQLAWTSTNVLLAGYAASIALTQKTASPGIAASAGTDLTVSNTIPVGVNGVLCFVGNSTSSVYQAGGGAASVTTTGDANTNGPGGLTLGASASPGNYANVRFFEVAVFSAAHDANTRLQILRYMARIAQVGGV